MIAAAAAVVLGTTFLEQFLSPKAHMSLQFGRFLLVQDSFFCLVGEESGPCRGLGLALRHLGQATENG